MNQDASAQFLAQIDRFVAGEATIAVANEIEGILLEHFIDEPWFDDVSVALAQYAPGGGEHYYTASEVAAELAVAVASIRSRLNDTEGTESIGEAP